MTVRAPRRTLACSVLSLAISVAACSPYDCIYRYRWVQTQGSAEGSPGGVLTAHAAFSDYTEEAQASSDLTWQVLLTDAATPPARLTLRDGRDTTIILAELPVQEPIGSTVANGMRPMTTAEDKQRTWDVLASGNGVIVALWESAPSAPVVVPLSSVTTQGWHRPNCS